MLSFLKCTVFPEVGGKKRIFTEVSVTLEEYFWIPGVYLEWIEKREISRSFPGPWKKVSSTRSLPGIPGTTRLLLKGQVGLFNTNEWFLLIHFVSVYQGNVLNFTVYMLLRSAVSYLWSSVLTQCALLPSPPRVTVAVSVNRVTWHCIIFIALTNRLATKSIEPRVTSCEGKAGLSSATCNTKHTTSQLSPR